MNLYNLLKPEKWSLRGKFLSIVLLILLIPLASIGLLKEIEKTLVSNLRENLLLSSRLIGNQLSQNRSWFEESLLPDSNKFIAKELFVFPLNQSFNLDGYFDDWNDYQQYRQSFNKEPVAFSVLLGSFERHLILALQVEDKKIIYPTTENGFVSDQFEIEFKNQSGEYQRISLAPDAAGSFQVKSRKQNEMKIDWRYKAYWIATENGFNIELKFPSGLKPNQIRIVQKNVDQMRQKRHLQVNSSSVYDFNPLVWPSKKIVNYIDQIVLPVAQRIWVLDSHSRVLASAGDLKTTEIPFSSNPIFNWFLLSQSELRVDPRANNLHLDSDEIYLAQKGIASTRIENIRNSEQSIALAAFPIKINEKIYGVLLLEENVARVQVLQKKTLISMFFIILVVFILIMWIVFWYVSKMVARIKNLNNAIDGVVDHQGRLQEPLDISNQTGDEIDDLNRAFSQMATRLYEYNDHLEKLASRLSHELRTPIAIVRSSLDNLLLSCHNSEDKEIIERALAGNQRLGDIITRMRQATGVKEAMQTAEKESIDIEAYLNQVIKGYSLSFTKFQFEFVANLRDKLQNISAELFAEMLDKLVANAMEFSFENTPILISLNQSAKQYCLTVRNSGPTIAKKNRKKIFQSLVSIRTNRQSTGTNLGLGLYVVKLIAEFHQARVKVQNLDDGSGVEFSVIWDNSK